MSNQFLTYEGLEYYNSKMPFKKMDNGIIIQNTNCHVSGRGICLGEGLTATKN
jgi:hypothetical protein